VRANASQGASEDTQNDDKIKPERAMPQLVQIAFQLRPHAIGIVGVCKEQRYRCEANSALQTNQYLCDIERFKGQTPRKEREGY
jgi:hypothetical protein